MGCQNDDANANFYGTMTNNDDDEPAVVGLQEYEGLIFQVDKYVLGVCVAGDSIIKDEILDFLWTN